MTDDFQAPQDGDANELHAAMLNAASADGMFARNLQVVAAELGWTPDRVSVAIQKLVEQDLVMPTHDDGRADRVASARWLVEAPKAKSKPKPAAKPEPEAEKPAAKPAARKGAAS